MSLPAGLGAKVSEKPLSLEVGGVSTPAPDLTPEGARFLITESYSVIKYLISLALFTEEDSGIP